MSAVVTVDMGNGFLHAVHELHGDRQIEIFPELLFADRLGADERLPLTREEIQEIYDANAGDTGMAAQQVDALTPKNVVVIPSKTVPQGVTAMLSFNPEGEVEENTQAMTEALDTVDTMQITYAARNSDFDGYDIHEGDYLALYGSALFGTSKDIKVLLKALAQKVQEEGKEYITIYYGADITEKQAQKAADLFAEICPDADVNLLNGGQPVYYYIISAE